MFFFWASFIYLAYLAVIALIIYVTYRIIDGWISRIIAVRKEQNQALRDIAEALRDRD